MILKAGHLYNLRPSVSHVLAYSATKGLGVVVVVALLALLKFSVTYVNRIIADD